MIRSAVAPRQPFLARRAWVCLVCVAAVCGALTTVRGASREPVRARQGMVASADGYASRAGVDMLKRGGNAIDAAVSVGFALAVTYPGAGNLGGGGFMVIRMADGREATIDYREVAPAAAQRDMFLDGEGHPVGQRSLVGPLAAGVPGSVAGLALAQRRYGRLPLATVMAPAIAFAREGFEISWSLAESLASHQALLSRFPSTARGSRARPGRLRAPRSARAPGERCPRRSPLPLPLHR